jgi:hypothetical protein
MNESETLLAEVRRDFVSAVKSARSARELARKIDREYPPSDGSSVAAIRAYRAALVGLEAKRGLNPLKKYDDARRAAFEMNKAVAADPTDLDARFLRFSFFHQLPAINNVHETARDDAAFVLDRLEDHPAPSILKQQMADYIADCRFLSSDARARAKGLRDTLPN